MTAPRRIARYAKLVPHDEAYAWLALGWMPHRDFEGRYPCDGAREGEYAVLLVWPCDCEMKRPIGMKEREPCRGFSSPGFEQGRQSEHDYVHAVLQRETQRDYDEEGLYGWGIDRRMGL